MSFLIRRGSSCNVHRGKLLLSLLAAGVCLLFMASTPALAQVDQAIYTDSLQNGWSNWSWNSTINFSNTTPVHSGTRSTSITITGGMGALYLHGTSFAGSDYTSLTFWLNGGATGGQTFNVQATLSGTGQPGVVIGPLVANTWTQYTIPLSSLNVATASNIDGFWIQDNTGAGSATFYVDDMSLLAVAVPSQVNVAVNAGSVVRALDNRHFSMNTAVWDSTVPNASTVSLLNEAGIRSLRFPGGSASDGYDWQTGKSGTTTWATTFDEFASTAGAISASAVYITANYGSDTPAHAAAWVQYSNVTKGYGFKYWEIGNENYGSWETDNNTRPHDPVTYATRFKDYYNQMKAVDPTIKVGAVVVAGEDSYANYADEVVTNPRTGLTHSGWTPVLLTNLKNLGVTPDFIIYHYYPQGPGGESDLALLKSTGSWAIDAANLRQQLSDYLGSAGANVEMTITENNSVSSGPGKQTTSLVNGLYLADSFGQLTKTEFKGLFWWDMRNGQETTNNNSSSLYGWRNYGDYGIVIPSDPVGPANRYPAFHAIKVLKYFGRGGDQVVSTTSDYSGLGAYGVKQANGAVAVMLINKHPTASLPVTVSLSGYSAPSTAYVYTYGKAQDTAAQTGSGSPEIAQSTISVSGSSFSYTTTPYSITVVSFAAPPPSAPAAPSNLAGTAVSASQINLTWSDNSTNETGFKVDRATNSGFTTGLVTTTVGANTTSFSATGLSRNTLYYFRVRAYNAVGDSANSATISVRTKSR